MKILFIDDDKSRHELASQVIKNHDVVHVYNVDQAIEAFKNDKFDLASFDHDLGDFRFVGNELVEFNGSKLASMMQEHFEEIQLPKKAISHSLSYSGALNIASKLRSMDIPTEVIQFDREMLLNINMEA